ncbi:MAG TPA: hypothetical protein PLY45_00335, partial [bacterium]|nr:hypothetical protein [bacterium]
RGIADTAAGFYRSAHRLVNDAVALVQRPAELVSGIIGTVGSIADLRFDWGSISTAYGSLTGLTGSALAAIPYTPTDAAGRVEVAGRFFDFGPETEPAFAPTPAGPATTIARRQEQRNTEAIAAVVQLTAVAVAAAAAGEVEYDSLDDALAQRAVISDKIDALMATEDDAVYQSLAALRTALVQAVPTPGEDLPNLVEIVNLETRPSLALAYSLYDSLDREGDIVRRNRIEHPGFVPGGPLKVIRNG